MIKSLALITVAAIGLLLAYAATRPDSFRVERSTTVAAPAAKLFPLINDLHRFNTWNPYNRKDPAMRGTYSGPAAGSGAVFDFQGNKEVGKGRIGITTSTSVWGARTLYRRLPYDPATAFAPIGLVTEAPMTLVARPGFAIGRMGSCFATATRNAPSWNGSSSPRSWKLFTGSPRQCFKTDARRMHDDADFEKNPEAYVIEKKLVSKSSNLTYRLQRGGGCAVVLRKL